MFAVSSSEHSKKRNKKHTRSRSRSQSPGRKSQQQHRSRHLKVEETERPSGRDRPVTTNRGRDDDRSRERYHRQQDAKEHPIRGDRQDRDTKPSQQPRVVDRAEDGAGDRRDRKSRFETVRVKEEPVSDDEDDRRRRMRRQQQQQQRPGKGDQPVRSMATGANADEPPAPLARDKPDFGLSGKLTEDANIFNGVVVKYSEPVEARKPNKKWRLYSFKGEQQLPMLPIHRQSAYLLGRERRVADIPIDHPSCSKQHAALQFRSLPYRKEDGSMGRRIRPYIIDLESANGTYINNNRIEAKRYVELMEKDVIKFGFSSREYVILHEGSSTGGDDDVSDGAAEDGASPNPA